MTTFIGHALEEAQNVLQQFRSNPDNIQLVENAIQTLTESYRAGGKAISCGNGGSLCDAAHFAEELTGRYKKDRPALAALPINDGGHISCVANDFGYEYIFSRQIEAFGRAGDVLLAISTSGNSENVIKAVEVAMKHKMKVIALLGKSGGKLKEMVDIPIVVPSDATERVQEVHIKLIHILIEGIERNLYPELYSI
jgi:D-sedoheptulose 7-phosphate isomerase